mgnify:FL=1
MTYVLAEKSEITHAQRLLPIGLGEGCRLKRDVAKDAVLTYDDVELPSGKVSVALRREQDVRFWASSPIPAAAAGTLV